MMKQNILKKLISVVVFLACILAGFNAWPVDTGPQTQTGTVSGKVFKPNFTACPDAKLELVMSKDSKLQAKTDAGGQYVFAGVPVGSNYTITASKEGFQPGTKSGVSVISQKTTTVNLVLKK